MIPYSVVIATYERPGELRTTLDSLASQTHPPAQTIVVDASPGKASAEIAHDFENRMPLRYESAVAISAAKQRNQGAGLVATPLIAFVDDDVFIPPPSLEKIAAAFAQDTAGRIGGIAGRIDGLQHAPPRGLLWWYYRLQAGYQHPTYGGKLFGPAINCLPTYADEATALASFRSSAAHA